MDQGIVGCIDHYPFALIPDSRILYPGGMGDFRTACAPEEIRLPG